MLPDPSGAGSLSPPPGLRIFVIVCNAVYPGPIAFGSAPASRRKDASSKWAFAVARISALVPARGAAAIRPLPLPAWIVSFTSAPAFSSARTTSIRPSRTANKSGVNPELTLA